MHRLTIMDEQKYLSTTELARLLNVSRITVFKRIKKGQIPATKVGRTYVIDPKDLGGIIGSTLTPAAKEQVEYAVRKTVNEYGQALHLLGND